VHSNQLVLCRRNGTVVNGPHFEPRFRPESQIYRVRYTVYVSQGVRNCGLFYSQLFFIEDVINSTPSCTRSLNKKLPSGYLATGVRGYYDKISRTRRSAQR